MGGLMGRERSVGGWTRQALQGGVKSVADGAHALHGRRSGVVVLAYHRVGPHTSAREIDLPRHLFEAQVAEIADRAITLDRALDALTGQSPSLDDAVPVVVTFDD